MVSKAGALKTWVGLVQTVCGQGTHKRDKMTSHRVELKVVIRFQALNMPGHEANGFFGDHWYPKFWTISVLHYKMELSELLLLFCFILPYQGLNPGPHTHTEL